MVFSLSIRLENGFASTLITGAPKMIFRATHTVRILHMRTRVHSINHNIHNMTLDEKRAKLKEPKNDKIHILKICA